MSDQRGKVGRAAGPLLRDEVDDVTLERRQLRRLVARGAESGQDTERKEGGSAADMLPDAHEPPLGSSSFHAQTRPNSGLKSRNLPSSSRVDHVTSVVPATASQSEGRTRSSIGKIVASPTRSTQEAAPRLVRIKRVDVPGMPPASSAGTRSGRRPT